MKKKQKIEDFNAKVIVFKNAILEDKENIYSFYDTTLDKPSQVIGITFTSAADLKDFNKDEQRVHTMFLTSDHPEILFRRYKIKYLKLLSRSVPRKLKDYAQKIIKHYHELGYLSNIAYLEALVNLKKIKISNEE